jgi:cytoskeletal protein CcmA (bactofilin family)
MLESPGFLGITSVAPSTSFADKNAGAPVEPTLLGRSLVIKGEVSGAEPLYIEGSVEGQIRVEGQRLTVGRGSHIKADISAHEVVILGEVKGNVRCGERLDIRREGRLSGDATMRSLSVEDGAVLKGSFEICKNSSHAAEVAEPKVAKVESAVILTENAGEPQRRPNESTASSISHASRVRGSRILYQETRKT